MTEALYDADARATTGLAACRIVITLPCVEAIALRAYKRESREENLLEVSKPPRHSSPPYVFISDTMLGQAYEIHAIVTKFAPGAPLMTHYADRFLPEDGFEYVELDPADPVQGPLQRLLIIRNAEYVPPRGGTLVLHHLEPMGVVLIVLGTIGTAIAQEFGKDLWTVAKRRIRALFGASPQQPAASAPGELRQLFEQLGNIVRSDFQPVVLLRLEQHKLTFVVEPNPSSNSITKAEHLVRRGAKSGDIPLRWSQEQNQWCAAPNLFRTEEELRNVISEINKRLANDQVDGPSQP